MKRSWIVFLLFFIGTFAQSQTVQIPDGNFRSFLKQNYPSVLNLSDELIIANANQVSGVFNCDGKNIRDINGIQYFTKIKQLILSHNQISVLPVLSGINVQVLDVSFNNLTALPDLSGLPNLQDLVCTDNKLTSLPLLDSLVNLQRLECSNNLLSELPSLDKLMNLQDLICNNNRLTKIQDLSKLVYIKRILLTQNKLTIIPDLSAHINLTDVQLDNNLLTFSDFFPSKSNPLFSTIFKISPQDSIGISRNFAIPENKSFIYKLDFSDTLSGTLFRWYLDGNNVYTSGDGAIQIDKANQHNAGKYVCEITNSKLPQLVLYSHSIQLAIEECKHCNVELTPDGDGINDVQFVNDPGSVRIFNKNGEQVKEFSSPGYWDGTNSSGDLVPSGMYIMEVNKHTQIKIIVIR